ncbi:MAG TPA: sulfite exporter TauE/SafE family protein [Gemmatimonadaceae bacterium]
MSAKDWLFIALGAFTLYLVWVIWIGVKRHVADGKSKPTLPLVATGAVTAFFDTLGIGSFATTTSITRYFKLVDDGVLPGTLNVGHALGTVAQAYIYTKLVPVDSATLILMIGASVVGAWLGAGIVGHWPKQRIQLGMGILLLGAAAIFFGGVMNWLPAGGNATSLTGVALGIGLVGNFALGALMTLGIGLYGPCMILVSLLGMNSTTAFPIMMGSCAFLMPVACARFIKLDKFDPGASLAIMIGGIPATLVAAFLVVSMPLTYVKWLVIVVVTYTAINMLRSAQAASPEPGAS